MRVKGVIFNQHFTLKKQQISILPPANFSTAPVVNSVFGELL